MQEDYVLSDYCRIVRVSWRLVVCITLGVGIVGGLVTMFAMPRQWRTATTILFEMSGPGLSSLAGMAELGGLGKLLPQLGGTGPASSQVAYTILTSRRLRAKVSRKVNLVQRLGLRDEYEACKFLGNATLVEVGQAGAVTVTVTLAGTPRGLLPRGDDDLEVRRLAKEIADAHVEALGELLAGFALTKAQRKCEFLRERVAVVKEELARARARLRQMQEATGMVTMPDAGAAAPLITNLAALEKEMVLAEAEGEGARRKLTALGEELTVQDKMVVSQIQLAASPVLDKLKEQIAQEQAELAVLLEKGYGIEHPDCRAHRERIRQLKESYKQELQQGLSEQARVMSRNAVRDGLLNLYLTAQAEAAGAEAQVKALGRAVKEAERRVRALPASLQELGACALDVELKAQIYSGLVSAYETARVEAEEQAPKFEVLDPAFVPEEKTGPSVVKSTVFYTFLGFMLALVSVLALNRSDNRGADRAEQMQ